MDTLDETDKEILDLLHSDARRPYSDIASAVDLSPPAVSDRIERLQELGIIRGFTVDIDRSVLTDGTPILLTVSCRPGKSDEIGSELTGATATEHVFRTVDETVVATLTVPSDDIERTVRETLTLQHVEEYDVQLLAGRDWQPTMNEPTFAPDCVECDNTVTEEGERERIDGDVYHFCCNSCRSAFLERYETLSDGI